MELYKLGETVAQNLARDIDAVELPIAGSLGAPSVDQLSAIGDEAGGCL